MYQNREMQNWFMQRNLKKQKINKKEGKIVGEVSF
jgi:hypothetical protein